MYCAVPTLFLHSTINVCAYISKYYLLSTCPRVVKPVPVEYYSIYKLVYYPSLWRRVCSTR